RRAAGRDAGGVPVPPVAVAGVDVERVGLGAAHGQRLAGRGGRPAGGGPGDLRRALVPQVVAAPGLVVDDGDDAGGARAEVVLGRRVGVATGAQHADVARRAVGGAADLVEVAG